MFGFGIKETSTTTGTGNLTIAGVTNFPRFSDKFPFGGARRFEYAILSSAGEPIENGIGYMVTDANTLVREKIIATFDGGVYDDLAPTAVSLAAGTKTVICTNAMGNAIAMPQNIDAGSTTNQPRRAAYCSRINYASTSSTGLVVTANLLYMVPFSLAQSVEATGMLIRVGTGVAAKLVRLGIYELGSTGYPTRLLAETGDLSAATSSTDVSGSFGSGNIKLSPGDYAVAMVSDGAISTGTASAQAFFSSFGGDSANAVVITHYRTASHTYGALPNPAPTASNRVTSATTARPLFTLLVA